MPNFRNQFWTQQVPRHVRERVKAAVESLPEIPEPEEQEDPAVVLYRYVCEELVKVNERKNTIFLFRIVFKINVPRKGNYFVWSS